MELAGEVGSRGEVGGVLWVVDGVWPAFEVSSQGTVPIDNPFSAPGVSSPDCHDDALCCRGDALSWDGADWSKKENAEVEGGVAL